MVTRKKPIAELEFVCSEYSTGNVISTNGNCYDLRQFQISEALE